MQYACWTATAVSGAHPMSERGRLLFREFASRTEACTTLADTLAEILEQAVEQKGSAAMVVSGGTSPAPMFRALRDRRLPWDRVTVVPSDEREVAPDHPERNEAMIRRELLAGRAAGATLAGLIPPARLPERFDVSVLGMGTDGHTASLFPGSPDLDDALRSGRALERLKVPQLGVHRVSLTPSALLRSDRIVLLFFGEDKRAVFNKALQGGNTGTYPVRVVLHQAQVPVEVYWAA